MAINSIDYITSLDTGFLKNQELLTEMKKHVLRLHQVSVMSSCFVIVSRCGIPSV